MIFHAPYATDVQKHEKRVWDQTIVSQLATLRDDREEKFQLRS
jgi:hypothetical protein